MWKGEPGAAVEPNIYNWKVPSLSIFMRERLGAQLNDQMLVVIMQI